MDHSQTQLVESVLGGGGEMGERMRAFDWSATALGPLDQWPQSLRTCVRIILGAGYPMAICWGPEYTLLYNDAQRVLFGTKHPAALGRSTREIFSEAWGSVGPLYDRVLTQGQAYTTLADQLFPLNRHGFLEESYFVLSYSPIRDDEGHIGGVFVTGTETTDRVIEGRRRQVLRDLASRTTEARSEDEVWRASRDTLCDHCLTIPFAFVYAYRPTERTAHLVGPGVRPDVLDPAVIDCARPNLWGLDNALAREGAIVALGPRASVLPGTSWPVAPENAAVLPVRLREQRDAAGFLVLGIHPGQAFDDAHREFVCQVAEQIAIGLASARAYEHERRRADALAETDRAKTAFFSNVSHELRTPLQLMLGPIEDLLPEAGERLGSEPHQQLLTVRRNALRLLTLVNTLLDFSRLEAGLMTAVYQPTDLPGLTSDIASAFRSAMESANLRFLVDCQPIAEPVFVDRSMWEKIVLNLLSNAFKFTFAGEVAISLKPVNGAVELQVRDTGVGIPDDQCQKVFARFHRVDKTSARTHEGTGIGLSLVQELVTLHGGSVGVKSAVGVGSTFTVTIPCGKGHLPAESIKPEPSVAPLEIRPEAYVEQARGWLQDASSVPPGAPTDATPSQVAIPREALPETKREVIVVADDNADMRDYLGRLLRDRYEVHAVADGHQALEAVRQLRPDLLLADVMMPQLDGFGLLRAIRDDSTLCSTPVILVSARAGEESRVEGLQADADDYLVKPFTSRELLARVASHVRLARYRGLAERERESRMIVDTIPGLVAMLTPTGEVEAVNEQVLAYCGRTLEELKQWGTSDTVHPHDLPRAIEIISDSMKSGDPYEIVERIRRFDGVYRWFQVRGLPLRNANGSIVRWYVLLTDIDDLKCAEALLDGEKRLLEMVGTGSPLQDILDSTCRLVDTVVGNSACSILLVDEEGTFRHGAGPGLPVGYEATVNGAPVVCEAGPCGTAASLMEQVIVSDLASEPRWGGAGWRPLVLEHGLKAVCSTPIVSLTGKVLGTFAIYKREPGPPGALLRDLIARFSHVASIAIERAATERDLRERERESRLVVDTIPGLVGILSVTGEIEVLNQRMLEYFGKPLEELKHWEQTDIVHSEDLPGVRRAFDEAIASQTFLDFEGRLRRFDGVYRWFQVRGFPARDGTGRVARWYVLVTDIDDLKRAEDALRNSERSFKLIIDTIPALAWSARPDGSAEFFNRHYLEFVGLPAEQASGWGWTAAVHPDDMSALAATWQQLMTTGAAGDAEARLRRSDGAYRWFLFRANPLRDEHGTIVKWYGINTDIEDRKQAEAELKRAYDSFADAQGLSHTGSFITDLLGDDHNWSEEAFRIFEFEPGTKVSVQRIRDIIHPDDLPAFESVIARGMSGENVTFAFRILTAAGAIKHVRGVAHVVEHVAGRPLFVGALQDVTESKVAEEALDRARSELAHVARVTAVSAFTASIAHEVNQPLSGIITNAGTCLRMLGADPPDVDGARETAKRTLRDGNRAAEVITRLRALFSKREFTLELLDFNEIAQEVVALSLSDLQRNRVVLRSEFAPDLPPVTGDRIQLQQVILNLLRNASDAMMSVHDRPRQLVVGTAWEAGNRVRLTVRDVGVGLDGESMNKLFDAFFTTKIDGMGIGLSVSRSIIERHHGRLWAEPNDGPGATFAFAIPAGPAPAAGPIDTKVQ